MPLEVVPANSLICQRQPERNQTGRAALMRNARSLRLLHFLLEKQITLRQFQPVLQPRSRICGCPHPW